MCTTRCSSKVVTDYDAILNDDSINCVVELMGGVTDAKDVSVVEAVCGQSWCLVGYVFERESAWLSCI